MSQGKQAPARRRRDPSIAPATVLFFGSVADVFGRQAVVSLPTRGCPLSEVRSRLTVMGAAAAAALSTGGVRAAVDRVLVDDQTWVRPGQEIAFFSLFSGG